MPGPLAGLRVLEIAGIGPGPFCCTMLADLGGSVARNAVRSPALIVVGEVASLGVETLTAITKAVPCPVS